MHWHVPVFILHAKRWRIRYCFLRRRPMFYRKTEVYEEGTAYTFCVGWLLIVALADSPSRIGPYIRVR